MATKEFLRERIYSIQSKINHSKDVITKKETLILKKRDLINKSVDTNEIYWINCDIDSLNEDIKNHVSKITEFTKQLNNYENQLAELESIKRDISVLVKFLNNWKGKVADYYLKERDSEERRSFRKEVDEAYDKYTEYRNSTSYSKLDQDRLTFLRREYRELDRAYQVRYAFVLNMEGKSQYHGITFEEELEKELQREWEAKYDDLLRRMEDVIGNITDASFLSVSPKGNIDGYVVGEKGKAKIDTIPAEGPIQRFHYRTLVHKID